MAIKKTSAYGILSNRDASAGNSKIADIPDAPTIGTATAGAASATVTYTAALTGGTATTFTALSNPGSITATGSSPITVSGLTASTAYTFTIKAGNTTGDSAYSSASNSITPTFATSYESIATISAGGTSSATFTSIPSTYKHLQIRALVRGAGSTSTIDGVLMRFNGDSSTSNYVTLHQVYGSGASAAAQVSTGNNWIYQSYITGTPALANTFGAYVTDILDYTSANKNKTTRTLCGTDLNGSGYITFSSGLWMNSSTAISSINMVLDGDNNFATGTQFALYGIRG